MTRQTISGQVDIEYRFSTTQNDGRITHRKDWISGEEVAYLYDTLGRMTSASTTGTGGWGQSFVFDGFGNLTQQVVTKGSAPSMSMTVNTSAPQKLDLRYAASFSSLYSWCSPPSNGVDATR